MLKNNINIADLNTQASQRLKKLGHCTRSLSGLPTGQTILN